MRSENMLLSNINYIKNIKNQHFMEQNLIH